MDSKLLSGHPKRDHQLTADRGRVQAPPGDHERQPAPQLRAFRTSDLEDAYRLDQVCFATGIAYSRSDLDAYLRMRNGKAWVAEIVEPGQTNMAGFVIACRDGRAQGRIITVDVAPEWRRHQVGTLLMEAAENWLRQQGGKMMYLETAEDNLPAQSFYFKRGYAKLRHIADYYADGAAAWLMAKTLDGSEVGRRQEGVSDIPRSTLDF